MIPVKKLGPGVRIGYYARGVLYVLIGTFALLASFNLGQIKDPKEIISFISSLPFGNVLHTLVVIGLASYGLWGVLRAVVSSESVVIRLGYLASAAFYFSLILPVTTSLQNKAVLLVIGICYFFAAVFQIAIGINKESKIARLGYITRGILFLVLGHFFTQGVSLGFGGALAAVQRAPFGRDLLSALAGGIICLGLYSFVLGATIKLDNGYEPKATK